MALIMETQNVVETAHESIYRSFERKPCNCIVELGSIGKVNVWQHLEQCNHHCHPHQQQDVGWRWQHQEF
ncbi:hypothetical protein Pcinc_020722 [Petrolisthes cinctipes]|uniref:Uncharacterized protein n=1 Tax=Petrolisthes cinctipes TaxID=88211 RepID=A0AAE1FHE9_PETCI|nr:hypothetical protein Pcinc_020722 [Petrolisthes cinctipes]